MDGSRTTALQDLADRFERAERTLPRVAEWPRTVAGGRAGRATAAALVLAIALLLVIA